MLADPDGLENGKAMKGLLLWDQVTELTARDFPQKQIVLVLSQESSPP